MAKELKIWLADPEPIIDKLKSLGGDYVGPGDSVHAYFKQPDGQVLKLVRADGQATIDKLERKGEQFTLISREPVSDADAAERELAAEHGLKAKLDMHVESYELNGYKVDFYDIKDKGRFLILTGDDPTVELLDEWFGIASPKLVTVSFDNL